MSNNHEASRQHGTAGGWRRSVRLPVVVACALIGGAIGGTGGFALAAGPWHDGWQAGGRLEHIQRMVRGALDSVGATTAQEDKIHDILATNFGDDGQSGQMRREMRKQMIDLLRAPTVDRAAVEKLRSEQVAAFDAKTKKIVGAILDAADQLTPDQRAKLADRFEMMAQHRHEMERWHGQGGMDGHGPGPDGDMDGHGPMDGHHGPMDDGHGPAGGPDGGPDKG